MHTAAPGARLSPVLEVRSPEGVTFVYELAEVPTRAAAWLVDLALLAFVAWLATLLGGALGMVWGDLGLAVQLGTLGMLLWAWPWAWEAWCGWTPGKRLLGLRVLREDGSSPDVAVALLRNVLRLVDALPLAGGLGVFAISFDPLRRRLGDRVAGTVVARAPEHTAFARLLRVQRLDASRFEQLPGLDVAVARLTGAERLAVQTLLRRRETLPLALRRDLFLRLAQHMERRLRVSIPDHLSAEGYLAAVWFAAVRRGERLRREGFS